MIYKYILFFLLSFIIILTKADNDDDDLDEKLNFTAVTEFMRREMINLITHETLIDFLNDLLVLHRYVNITMSRDNINVLIEAIDYNEFIIEELLMFRNQFLDFMEKKDFINREAHLKNHVITDLAKVYEYLHSEFEKFVIEADPIEDRFSFECKMRNVDMISGSLEMMEILMFWIQAIYYFPDEEINSAAIRKAILKRVKLERPHFHNYFKLNRIMDKEYTN